MATKLSWIVPAVLIAARGASAAPIPCVSSSLAGYTALSMGCSIDSTVFSGFSGLASVGTPIDPASVLVTPINSAGNLGFRFDLDRTAGAGQAFGILIGYAVANVSGGSIELNGSSVTPDGVNTGILNACSGDYDASGPINCTGSESFGIAFDDGVSAQLLASLGLPPGSYDVFADLAIDGGLNGGATLASVTVLHTAAVPEPATWSAVLAGLAWAGLRKPARNK
jgi:hypothetical protein